MDRIILYYKFHPIKDPLVFKLWQISLCQRLNLKGRIIVSPVGLNGTLGGKLAELKAYKKELNEIPYLRDMEYKWSVGSAADFPKLSVKVRPEPVTLAPDEPFDAQASSTGLTPEQWHDYLKDNPETVVLDARNAYESEIGHFKVKNLIRPPIKTFKEVKPYLKDLPKDKPLLTYCTGDIRCEYLSAYMQQQGFKTVHHLKGGIIKYGQKYGDDGFWQGKCYVFDARQKIAFSDSANDTARCLACQTTTSEQVNCDDCNNQLVVCLICQQQPYYHCQRPTVAAKQR